MNQARPWGRGIQSTEPSAPHVRMWNPTISMTYTGDLVDTITLTDADGTVCRSTCTYDASGNLTSVSSYVEVP